MTRKFAPQCIPGSLVWLAAFICCLSTVSPSGSFAETSARTVGIAVIQDGHSLLYDDLRARVEKELEILIGKTHQVRWMHLPQFNARWNLHALPLVLQNGLEHEQVDLVFSPGVLTTAFAARGEIILTKPVVGGVIPETASLDLPYSDNGYSTKENLTFVLNPHRIKNDVQAFHDLVPFRRLHVLVHEQFLRGLDGIQDFSEDLGRQKNMEIHLLPAGSHAAPVLESLPSQVEAVYITPLMTMSREEQQRLVEELNSRRIPTFAFRGFPDVEMGVLAGLAPGDKVRFARRIALNIQQILLGQAATDLPVLLHEEDSLVINARTAQSIGFSPTFSQWMEAVWVDRPDPSHEPSLTLEDSMLLAAERNLALDIERSQREVATQAHLRARSRLLPQVMGEALYVRLDKDRAQASLGLIPQERTTLGVSLRQMIFDDAIISGWRATGRLARAQELEMESRRLDVLAEAGHRYLQLLSARALLRIEREILELTQTHLRMAQTRRQIGISGPEDVYRWESETARRKSALYSAQTQVEQARVALNQTLNVDQDTVWNMKDIVLEDDHFYFLDDKLPEIMGTLAHWERLQELLTHLALEQAPEIKALEKMAEAQGIELDRVRRRFTTPSVHAQFTYERELDATRPGAGSLPFPIPEPDKNDWSIGLAVSIPLFEGGGRVHDLRKSQAELRGLQATRDEAAQLISQRIKSALFALQSSHPNIHLTREAARLAHETLKVIQDRYARGTVNIIDLLDAQNQVAVQDQAAALAVYNYLRDLIECQRALAWFEADKSREEKETFLGALKGHILMESIDDPHFLGDP